MDNCFSIGLTYDMSRKEFLNILDKYDNNIKEVYFSLPLGDKYHTRRSVAKNLSPKKASFSDFVSFIKEIKNRKKELCLALNTHALNEKDVFSAIERLGNEVEIDSIVTFNQFADKIKSNYPGIKLTLSIHEGITKFSDVDIITANISTIVIGNSELRNIPLINYIKSKGFKTKLLLNTGCNCVDFCSGRINCKSSFKNNLSKFGYNFLYACQSIMPFELHKYLLTEKSIDIYKIANRDCDYNWLDLCMDSYVNNLNKSIILQDKFYYNLWARYTWLNTRSAFKVYNYNEIVQTKELLWEILNQNNALLGSHSNSDEELLNLLKTKCNFVF